MSSKTEAPKVADELKGEPERTAYQPYKPEVLPTTTGKCRVVQDIYNFKYYIEREYTDGTWQRDTGWPPFSDVKSAHDHFQRSKKAMKTPPADLGDINAD